MSKKCRIRKIDEYMEKVDVQVSDELTEQEEEMIKQMNGEVPKVEAISHKETLSKTIEQFDGLMNDRLKDVEKQVKTQNSLLELLKKENPNYDNCFTSIIEQTEELYGKFKGTQNLVIARLQMKDKINDIINNNYCDLVTLNFYLGNPMKLSEVEEMSERYMKELDKEME